MIKSATPAQIKNVPKKYRIESVEKLSLIKKGSDFMFAVECKIENGEIVRIDPNLAKEVIGCTAKECLSMDQNKMQEKTNLIGKELIGKYGDIIDGVFVL